MARRVTSPKEIDMRFQLAAAAGCFALAALTIPTVSSAATFSGAAQAQAGQQSTLAETVQYWGRGDRWDRPRWRDDRPRWGGRCRAWRHECADRWGWGGPGFRRCLWRHGC